ncbi:MAG: thioredoxin domain-containing protein [Bacteroides sp.]|nr:thioredoxin domain-containing protein [Bacteroides sp.]
MLLLAPKKLVISIKEFLDLWSGAVLVPESTEASVEPDYEQHKREAVVISIQKILLLLNGIILAVIGLYQNHILQNSGLVLLLILNLIGIYIGYLLVQKQINIHSNAADNICSLFAKSDCNDILTLPVAKFLGVVGWSELGLGYFLSNTFLILFAPNLCPYLALINILVLPYSFWSIWYQKFRAKTWCPLCLIVQLLFWLLFIVNFTLGLIQLPEFSVLNMSSIALIYGIPLLLINLLLPYQITGNKLIEITQQFNSLKMDEKVFLGLLKEQTFYEIDESVSTIVFGGFKAKNTITIFSNPHCGPCARIHQRIEKLLKDTNNQFRVQYILSSFDSTLDSSCEFFLYVNKKYPIEERNKIYDEWFDNGKYDKENFFKKYAYVADDNVSPEYQTHLEWKRKTKLQATPTVLFDGYELPEMYFQQIEKLIFFTDLEVDTR